MSFFKKNLKIKRKLNLIYFVFDVSGIAHFRFFLKKKKKKKLELKMRKLNLIYLFFDVSEKKFSPSEGEGRCIHQRRRPRLHGAPSERSESRPSATEAEGTRAERPYPSAQRAKRAQRARTSELIFDQFDLDNQVDFKVNLIKPHAYALRSSAWSAARFSELLRARSRSNLTEAGSCGASFS